MAALAPAEVPRSFQLLDELAKVEGGLGAEACSYGPADDRVEYDEKGKEIFLYHWNGTILGPPHSVHENRIYSLQISCGLEYPDLPPEIVFTSKINLPCVDQRNGKVDPTKLPCLAQWKREYTMETVLLDLRRSMALPQHKKLPQPAEGATY